MRTDQDAEARALVARVLRDAPPDADADLLAGDVLHVLRGHGWRPSAARRDDELWRTASSEPATAEQAHAYAETIRRKLRPPAGGP